MSRRIRLLNLSTAVSESRLRRTLSQVGSVTSLRIEPARADAATTWAEAEVGSELEANLVALVLEGRTLGGRVLKCQLVDEAQEPELGLALTAAKVSSSPANRKRRSP